MINPLTSEPTAKGAGFRFTSEKTSAKTMSAQFMKIMDSYILETGGRERMRTLKMIPAV